MALPSLTPLAMAVLDLLHERDMHPYEMRQLMVNRQTDRIIKLKAGSLYHTVERLQRDELIESAHTDRAGRRPERTTYTLTEAGRDAFAARLRDMLAVPADEYPAYPVALAFAHTLDPADALTQLEHRQVRLAAAVAADEATHDRLAAMDLPTMYWIDVTYKLSARRAELDWTTTLIEDLRAGRIEWPRAQRSALTLLSGRRTRTEENAG